MTWVQVDRHWPERVGLFCVDVRRLEEIGLLVRDIATDKEAEVASGVVVAALLNEHPDLKGGQLLTMHFDFRSMQVEFMYTHLSLPLCGLGQEPKKFRFMSDEQYDDRGWVIYGKVL